jgi:hypothetical protein
MYLYFDLEKLSNYHKAGDVMNLMKLFVLTVMSLLIVSCSDILNVFDNEDPNELGGDTDLELTKVGNEYGVYFKLNDRPLKMDAEAKIVKNDNGIVTIHVKINLDKLDPLYKAIIPAEFKNSDGNVDTEIKFKATSEGIQDFYHSKGDVSKPFTIVKYGDKVGAKYTFKRDDGIVVTRKITAKSTEDDFPMGFMLIKTMTTVEEYEDENIEKVIYYTNHKFGLVYVIFRLKNGVEGSIELIPWAMV